MRRPVQQLLAALDFIECFLFLVGSLDVASVCCARPGEVQLVEELLEGRAAHCRAGSGAASEASGAS